MELARGTVRYKGLPRVQTASRLGSNRDRTETARDQESERRRGEEVSKFQVHSTGLLYTDIQDLDHQGLLFENGFVKSHWCTKLRVKEMVTTGESNISKPSSGGGGGGKQERKKERDR
ncbi:hypothetical protein M0802_008069 [Mischocyttarus mexicanus]|nr:hypothetical protein M0802_008069 [Mischocyttarus mexicanus]